MGRGKTEFLRAKFIIIIVLVLLFLFESILISIGKVHILKKSKVLDIPKNGEVKYEVKSEYTYRGMMQNGVFVGKGALTKKNSKYKGKFKDNYFAGEGKYISKKGYKYVGNFKKGLPNGHGIAYLTNGDVYNGSFRKGMRDGFGIYTKKNGERLEGEWIHNIFKEGLNLEANKNFDFEISGKNEITVTDSLEKTVPKENDKKVTIIGDSVVFIAEAEGAFKKYIPNANVDALVSRRLANAGLMLLRKYKKIGMLNDIVVIGLSTNGNYGEKVAKEAIDICGKDRNIIFITGYSAGESFVDLTNKTIRKMAKKYSNVYVADWERAVKKYNYKLTSDKIHISGETTKKYVKLIAKEIKKINSKMTGIFTAYNNISVDSFSPFKLPISTLGDSEVMNKLKYKSSNEKVATISNRGVVSPKNKGKTVITVALSNQEFIKIKINIIPKNTAKKNYSKKGVCYIADAKIYPRIHLKIKNRKTIYSVPKFEIEDKTIATVDEAGIIYAKKKGKTRIKCSLEDYTAYINLEIKRKRKNK